MSESDEQRLAALLRVLRPAPAAWVQRAQRIAGGEQPDGPPKAPAADAVPTTNRNA